MTENFLRTQKLTDRCEGGYSNKSSDRGKETLFGVSRPNNPDWEVWPEVDALAAKLGRGSPAFIEAVNNNHVFKEKAYALYEKKYWTPVRGDDLPWELAVVVYDMSVNSGPGTAIKMLTKVLAKMGCGLARDRVLSDAHVEFLQNIMVGDSYGDLMELWYLKRVQKYQDIVATYPDQMKNWKGWINRLKFLSQATMEYIPTCVVEATPNS